jgi:hypothetical protein
MLAIDLANYVGTVTLEALIEIANLITLAAVGSLLLIRIQIVLAAVEDAEWRDSCSNSGTRLTPHDHSPLQPCLMWAYGLYAQSDVDAAPYAA